MPETPAPERDYSAREPERDYSAPEPRPAPAQADFERPTESWSPPPEPSYRDAPQEPSAPQANAEPESAPAGSDERQTG
jgi:hypothetical protein